MNFLQLEYFRKVAHYQSVTKAAKAIGISQSALSIMMSKLEDELGYTLFQRQGRNIVLNKYGRQVLYYSYIILHEVEDLQQEFKEMQGMDEQYQISLGVTDNNYYGDWIIELYEEYPELKIKVLQMSREEIQSNLLTGNLDFGIVTSLENHSRLAAQQLISQPYQLLVLKNHPLAQKETITIEELAAEPLISLPPSHKERLVDNLSWEAHFKPHIVFEGNQDIMIEMLHAGVGSILTCPHNRHQWMQHAPENYATLTITGIISRYEIYLTWSRHRYMSKYARIFQEYVFQYYHV